jgi:hypothetical protein
LKGLISTGSSQHSLILEVLVASGFSGRKVSALVMPWRRVRTHANRLQRGPEVPAKNYPPPKSPVVKIIAHVVQFSPTLAGGRHQLAEENILRGKFFAILPAGLRD